jgi:hypothetical protein
LDAEDTDFDAELLKQESLLAAAVPTVADGVVSNPGDDPLKAIHVPTLAKEKKKQEAAAFEEWKKSVLQQPKRASPPRWVVTLDPCLTAIFSQCSQGPFECQTDNVEFWSQEIRVQGHMITQKNQSVFGVDACGWSSFLFWAKNSS